MEEIFSLINQHVAYAHWIIFAALLLAGFNIPVSEDAMLFISAILAAKNPDQLIPLFLGVYLGAFFSDVICFMIGRLLGPKLFKHKLFAKTQPQVEKMATYYEKFGTITLFCGRFIPFGVRNALFLTAGISRMSIGKFLLADLAACTISCTFFFYLYYTFGEGILAFVRQANIALFSIAAVIIAVLFFRARRKKILSAF